MRKRQYILIFGLVVAIHQSWAQEIHVSPTGGNVWPYDSLAKAATNINRAVNIAPSGASILVHPGTYLLTNSLVIWEALSIVGVEGAATTILDGNESAPCIVSYSPETLIEGLTIQRGRASGNYDIYNYYDFVGGGIALRTGGVVRACVIRNNSAGEMGGGIYVWNGSLIDSCMIQANDSGQGGGVYLGLQSELRNCVVAYNHAAEGGGVYSSGGHNPRIRNSTIVFNSADSEGGGVNLYNGSIENSIVYYNEAPFARNWYHRRGGSGMMSNSCTFPIPTGEENIPDPPQFLDQDGGDFHLRPYSLCIDSGIQNAWMDAAMDLDGNPRVSGPQPDLGAFEFQPTNLFVSVHASPRRGTMPMQVTYGAAPHGASPGSLYFKWDLDADGIADAGGWGLTNYQAEYTQAGIYDLALTVSNASDSFFMVFSNMVSVSPAEIYVSETGLHVPPFTNLATAATNIQVALDLAMDGAVVWMDEGRYPIGDTLFHHRPVTVKSLHGKEKTILDGMDERTVIQMWNPAAQIEGVSIVRGNGWKGGGIAALGGGRIVASTLTSNKAENGGGIFGLGAVSVSNCDIAFNTSMLGEGGGIKMEGGEVLNCRITHNGTSDSGTGGGMSIVDTIVRFCSVSMNQARMGGGMRILGSSWIDRCMVVSNVATWDSSWSELPVGGGILYDYGGGYLANSLIAWNESAAGGGIAFNLSGPSIVNCTITHNSSAKGAGSYHRNSSPKYTNSIISHNIGDDVKSITEFYPYPLPQFVNTDPGSDVVFQDVPRGDFRLRWDSPGINAGTNLPEQVDGLDLEGKPRILDGIVDRGAYEQYPPAQDTDGDGLPDGWEWQYYGGVTNALPGQKGADGRYSNTDHHIAGTDPRDPASYPRFDDILVDETNEAGQVVLHWESFPGRIYSLYRCHDLTAGIFDLIEPNLPSTSPENTYIDIGASGSGPWMYRLGIRLDE